MEAFDVFSSDSDSSVFISLVLLEILESEGECAMSPLHEAVIVSSSLVTTAEALLFRSTAQSSTELPSQDALLDGVHAKSTSDPKLDRG